MLWVGGCVCVSVRVLEGDIVCVREKYCVYFHGLVSEYEKYRLCMRGGIICLCVCVGLEVSTGHRDSVIPH